MAGDIVYTLGIVIVALLFLMFLRSILLRRQRLAASQAAIRACAHAHNGVGRGNPGMNITRPEPAITDIPILPSARSLNDQDRDQLPLYEAPPPEYDSVPKDLERGEGGVVLEEQGESSRMTPGVRADPTPPGYGVGDERGAVGNNEAPVVGPALPPAAVLDASRGSLRVDVRTASGFG